MCRKEKYDFCLHYCQRTSYFHKTNACILTDKPSYKSLHTAGIQKNLCNHILYNGDVCVHCYNFKTQCVAACHPREIPTR